MTTKMFGALGVVLLIVWLAASVTRTGRSATEIQLLETGEFHSDEVSAKTGEQWLGLFPTRAGFALLPSTIAIDAVHDSVVDEDPKPKVGEEG